MSPTLPKFFTYLLPVTLFSGTYLFVLNFPSHQIDFSADDHEVLPSLLVTCSARSLTIANLFQGLWKLAGLYGSHFSNFSFYQTIERIDKTAI
jgi:hypothetical protein